MTQEVMRGLLPGVNVESLWPKYKTKAVWWDASINNQNYKKMQLLRELFPVNLVILGSILTPFEITKEFF